MSLSSTNLSQIWLQISKYQSQINLLVVILLVLYLLAFLAEMTWRLIPEPESTAKPSFQTNQTGNNSSNSSSRVSLSQLKSLNLFGDLTAKENAPVKQEITEAPETRLNLTLTGVVETDEPGIGAAIIENRGSQNTYGIDDEIDGTNASLVEVFADRVIIKNGPRRETLMLDGLEYSKESQAYQAPVEPFVDYRVAEKEQHKELSADMVKTTKEIRRNPSGFTEYFMVSPVQGQDGLIAGYKIAPGKNPSLFKGAGFKVGDIITEINGLDLTDPEQAIEALAALNQADSLQLSISRSEEVLTLYLNFPDGEEEQDI
ncbi:MAG: type II secretion system protein GspC [Aliiglaciecola sp.]|uniref:type II secretion system protein GspC n=1 Tax=Aliiglaciecola sp. TaxID=1872441 RepID=UPI0032986D24